MIKIEKIENKDIYTFKIEGKIDKQGIDNFESIFDSYKDKKNTLKLIAIIDGIPDFENFESFTETMKMKFSALGILAKYAIISEKKWMEKLIPVADFLTPNLPIEFFEKGKINDAIEWLEKDE